ncbi:MAG: hypothetical protein H0X13_20580 [Ramlibacter sp.]|nr:hypothetical protein [Ramlibacter sp.]
MKRSKLLLALAVVVGAGLIAFKANLLPLGGTQQEQVKLLDPAQVIVLRTPGGMLEVATLNRVEDFGWQTTYTCPILDCGKLLGATVTRLRVPVHYTYRVPLAATWELRPDGKEHVLHVPPVQPALPPAIDTAKVELETHGGWMSPGRQLNVQSTLRQLGPELERRATQPHYLQMQEPHAAKTVAEFASKWMREQGKAPPPRIRVVFRTAGAG